MAINQEVTYTMSLKDMLSGKLRESADQAHHLEENLHHAKDKLERLANIAEAFGVSFDLYKLFEFGKESKEVFEKLHLSEAQLKNTMENMGTYSEEAFEKVIEKQKAMSKNVNYNVEDFLQLQAQLRMVGNIGEGEFDRMSKISADIAAKFGGGLTEAGELLAKAVNNPELARRLSQKIKIDPAVMDSLHELASSGHEATARLKLLEIAEHQVGGAAEAAFNADPMAKFNKAVHDMKQDLGSLLVLIAKFLAPIMQSMVNHTREAVHWLKEHKKMIGLIATALGAMAAAYVLIKVEQKAAIIVGGIWDTLVAAEAMGAYMYAGAATSASLATRVWTGVQIMLNEAITANPIGILIVAIAGAVAAIIYCYHHFDKFRATLWATWGVIKEFGSLVADIFMGVYHSIHGAFRLNPKEVSQGLLQALDATQNAGLRLAKAAKDGWDAGIKDFAADNAKPKTADAPKGKKTDSMFGLEKVKDEAKGAKGSKNTTINVKIGSLISGGFKVETRNVHEAAGKVKEMVTQTLLDAMNNSQMIAGS